jgi:uncharacterized protein
MVSMPDFKKARDYALNRLAHELSPDLIYHCLGHTQNEVVPAAELLATLENVGDEDHLLLMTGAYFHDLGFIRQRQDHESVSIQLAEQALPVFGYSPADIAAVSGIIQATRLPQSPTTLLERIIADADMDDLGHKDFWKRSSDLRRELELFGINNTDVEWYGYQLRLLESHHYFTESERAMRDALKLEHMLEVKQLLEQAYIANR